ncbi:MAG: sigma 54-interacting transcriptional regulator [Pseudomonadota bacterium]
MAKRKIIFISNDADSSIVQCNLHELLQPEWELVAAQKSPPRSVDPGHDAAVGLACINSSESFTPQLERSILAYHATEWIALVSSDALRRTSINKMISDLFHDYHTLPLDRERLLMSLGHAYGKAGLRKKQDDDQDIGQYQMIGTSPAMQELYGMLRKMRATDAPALITGESGTGKELAARAIHQISMRAHKAFVALNCASLPADLIQTELFGHEKGAFTDAHQRKIGRIEAAAGGTIFLDEIGDLPSELQANLLRFLQEKVIQRVGSNITIPVDVRVIAATNVDLEKAVESGRFRQDLYYRINVLRIKLPPLRDRKDDIGLLAQFYFDKFSKENKSRAKNFSQQALTALRRHDWPGNVRELINRIRRALVMTENRLLTPGDLGLEENTMAESIVTLDRARDRAEQEVIQRTLRYYDNNMLQTARQLGISRATLYRLVSKFPAGKGDYRSQ